MDYNDSSDHDWVQIYDKYVTDLKAKLQALPMPDRQRIRPVVVAIEALLKKFERTRWFEFEEASKLVGLVNEGRLYPDEQLQTAENEAASALGACATLPPALAVVAGLAVGDALGASSEWYVPWQIAPLFRSGWPVKFVGAKIWQPGEPTDDTDLALCILESYAICKEFDAVHISKMFLQWLETDPKDVGTTIGKSLSHIKGDNYWEGAKATFSLKACANGSLMRNGTVPIIFHVPLSKMPQTSNSQFQVIESCLLQSIITHYSPSPVIACVVHGLLIHDALQKHERNLKLEGPPHSSLVVEMVNLWRSWKTQTNHPVCLMWLKQMANVLEAEEKKFLSDLGDWVNFDPYNYDIMKISGWSTLSLKIALWALHWSFGSGYPSCGVPPWLPLWPFQFHGFRTILWVALIGADADTYGAIAGPLLAVYHPNDIPISWLQTLQAKPKIENFMSQLGVNLEQQQLEENT